MLETKVDPLNCDITVCLFGFEAAERGSQQQHSAWVRFDARGLTTRAFQLPAWPSAVAGLMPGTVAAARVD